MGWSYRIGDAPWQVRQAGAVGMLVFSEGQETAMMDRHTAPAPLCEGPKNFPIKIAGELEYIESVLGEATSALAELIGRNHGNAPGDIARGANEANATRVAGAFDQVGAQIERVRFLAHQLRDQAYSLNATH